MEEVHLRSNINSNSSPYPHDTHDCFSSIPLSQPIKPAEGKTKSEKILYAYRLDMQVQDQSLTQGWICKTVIRNKSSCGAEPSVVYILSSTLGDKRNGPRLEYVLTHRQQQIAWPTGQGPKRKKIGRYGTRKSGYAC